MLLFMQVQWQAKGCKEVGNQEGLVSGDQFGCHIFPPLFRLCRRFLVGEARAPPPWFEVWSPVMYVSPSYRFSGFLIAQLGVPGGSVLSVSTKSSNSVLARRVVRTTWFVW